MQYGINIRSLQEKQRDTIVEEIRMEWGDLTREALVDIFSRLELEERWNPASLVCKGWLAAFKDPFLWQELDLEHYFHRRRDSPQWWSQEFQFKIDRMVRTAVDNSHGGLSRLSVRHCADDALIYAAHRCPNLEYLSIKECQGVTDASICEVASHCPLIKELDISYCHNISCSAMEKIGLTCRNLTTVKRNLFNTLDPSETRAIVPTEYIRAAPLSGDDEAFCFAKFMPNLKHLEMKFSNLSAKGLQRLVEGCMYLEHLDLSGCSNLTSRASDHAYETAKHLKNFIRPNFMVPRSAFHVERYGHWQLYDDRFQTDVFQI